MSKTLLKIAEKRKEDKKEKYTEEPGYMASRKASVRALAGKDKNSNGYISIKDKKAAKEAIKTGAKNAAGGAGIGGVAGALLGAAVSKKGGKKAGAKIGALIGATGGGETGFMHGARKGDLKTLKERGIDQSYFGMKTKMTKGAAKKYLSAEERKK